MCLTTNGTNTSNRSRKRIEFVVGYSFFFDDAKIYQLFYITKSFNIFKD